MSDVCPDFFSSLKMFLSTDTTMSLTVSMDEDATDVVLTQVDPPPSSGAEVHAHELPVVQHRHLLSAVEAIAASSAGTLPHNFHHPTAMNPMIVAHAAASHPPPPLSSSPVPEPPVAAPVPAESAAMLRTAVASGVGLPGNFRCFRCASTDPTRWLRFGGRR